jgi:hypothetical protein
VCWSPSPSASDVLLMFTNCHGSAAAVVVVVVVVEAAEAECFPDTSRPVGPSDVLACKSTLRQTPRNAEQTVAIDVLRAE